MKHKIILTGKVPFLAVEIAEDMIDFSNSFGCMLFYKRTNNIAKIPISKFSYLSSDCSPHKEIVGKLSEMTEEQFKYFSDSNLELLIKEQMPICKHRKSKVDYLILKFI